MIPALHVDLEKANGSNQHHSKRCVCYLNESIKHCLSPVHATYVPGTHFSALVDPPQKETLRS